MPPINCSNWGEIRPNAPTLSLFGGTGLPITALSTNGMKEKWVTSCLVTTFQKLDTENFGVSTIDAPTPSADQVDQLCAFTWKYGR